MINLPFYYSQQDASVSQNDQSDLEEGEIFSDDEEAAYYPNLVKSRYMAVRNNIIDNCIRFWLC